MLRHIHRPFVVYYKLVVACSVVGDLETVAGITVSGCTQPP